MEAGEWFEPPAGLPVKTLIELLYRFDVDLYEEGLIFLRGIPSLLTASR